jgi:cob(I)alamin adenosyltransferase
MSIVTKTGDRGATSLMYNRRVPKTDPRVEAYGGVDELNASVGLARAAARHEFVCESLLAIQKDLVIVMGELATLPEDLPRYQNDGFSLVTGSMTASLEKVVREIETQLPKFHGWSTPGGDASSAALEMARAVCRRAERHVCALHEAGQLPNAEMIVYLNRLSDLLWLLARWVEARGA